MTGITEVPGTLVTPKALSGAALRREQGRREMRAAILDEARRLLTEEGAGALSMRAIARALGYSPAALYEYFPAKEDILAALYFEGTGGLAGRMAATVAALPSETGAYETLNALGRAYRAFAHEQPELFRLVFGDTNTHGQKADADGERPGFDVLVHVIERGIAAGEIVPLPAEPVAIACWSIVHGFVTLEINGFFGRPALAPVVAAARPDASAAPGGRHPPPSPDALYELILDRMFFGVKRQDGDGKAGGES